MNYCRAIALSVCLAAIPLSSTAFAGNSSSAAVPAHPTRGMTMKQVRQKFGSPRKMLAPTPPTALGPLKPPIVRWIYPDFIVYFERDRVIHTVLTHPREAPVPKTTNPHS